MVDYIEDLAQAVEGLYPYELQRQFEVTDSVCGEEISLNFYLGDFHIGDAEFYLSEDNQKLRWIEFFPFREVEAEAEDFQGKGIGTLAHVKSLLHIIEEYGLDRYCNVSHARGSVSSVRQSHLQDMGLIGTIDEIGIALIDYLTASINYANNKDFEFESPF